MSRPATPLDIIYPIVLDIIVDRIDELLVSVADPQSKSSAHGDNRLFRVMIASLLASTVEIRRITLTILSESLNMQLNKEGIWRLLGNPCDSVDFAFYVIRYYGVDRSAEDLCWNQLKCPLYTFYVWYLAARHDLAQAEMSFHQLTHFTLEDGQIRELDEPVQSPAPMQYALCAERRLAKAVELEQRIPLAFHSRLAAHTAALKVRIHSFLNYSLGANEISAKLSTLVSSTRAGSAVSTSSPSLCDCLLALEHALSRIEARELAFVHWLSVSGDDQLAGRLLESGAHARLLTVLRRVPTADVLNPAKPQYADASEMRERCKRLSEKVLGVLEASAPQSVGHRAICNL